MALLKGRVEDTVRGIIDEGISFGEKRVVIQGVDATVIKPSNFDGEFLFNKTTNSTKVVVTGGTEKGFEHHLGRIPEGFLIADQEGAGTIKPGSTPWTERKVYLEAIHDYGDFEEEILNSGNVITITSGAEVEISHSLGRIPTGYRVVYQNIAGSIFIGSTSWTTTKIYLRADPSDTDCKITVFPKDMQTDIEGRIILY